MTSLGSSTHTLCLAQETHPTELFGTLDKETAWKLGDDCTVSTTRRRPSDVWRSFSKFRTHRDVSELRIWELHWRIDWLSTKRQYEMFTDWNGRPCQASDDSLVAAMIGRQPCGGHVPVDAKEHVC